MVAILDKQHKKKKTANNLEKTGAKSSKGQKNFKDENSSITHELSSSPILNSFTQLDLKADLFNALSELGYESPTPIQARSIPILLNGHDLLAQAQTGTGKTAAFALPILSLLDLTIKKPQAIIIAPTRELAIQVAEAFQSYAKHMKGFHITPIYGGQDYRIQLRSLSRGPHVIVGTPGRVQDQLRRGNILTDALKMVVLDEADEMLKMGFVEDVEWILQQIKQPHQTALFSATMPVAIQKISKKYLTDAQKVLVKAKKAMVDSIEQCYLFLDKGQKFEALTRFLSVEDIEAAIVFVRTKTLSAEVSSRLQARGYAAEALNGDMNQSMRERVLNRMRQGTLDVVIATDVAARGIDIQRMSHVINYDIPYDVESYIHRIGRTGRAGKKGKAILFVSTREKRLLKDIERVTQKSMKLIEEPTRQEMTEKRNELLAEKITNILTKSNRLQPYYSMIDSIVEKSGYDTKDIAVALSYLLQQNKPLPSAKTSLVEEDHRKTKKSSKDRKDRKNSRDKKDRKNSRNKKNNNNENDRNDKKRSEQRSAKSKSYSRTKTGEERSSRSSRSSRSPYSKSSSSKGNRKK